MSEFSNPPISLPPAATNALRSGITWFSATSSRKTAAALAIVGGRVCAVNEDGERREALLRELEISPRLGNAPRRLVFPDGTAVVADDNDAVEKFLRAAGGGASNLHKLESAWKFAFLTIIAAAIVLYLAMALGVPAAADFAARSMSEKQVVQLGDRVYQQIIKHEVLDDSTLPAAEQERVQKLFAEVSAPWQNNGYNYRVKIHQFTFFGTVSVPNAFALPDGTIVVTDELAELLSDDEMRAVLAHEIGHVEMRHGLRSVLGSLGTGLYLAMLGDVSLVLSGGVGLLELKYSRAYEEEADCFAYRYLRENNLDGALVGKALLKIEDSADDMMKEEFPHAHAQREEESVEAEGWMQVLEALSTHPATEARLNPEKSCAA